MQLNVFHLVKTINIIPVRENDLLVTLKLIGFVPLELCTFCCTNNNNGKARHNKNSVQHVSVEMFSGFFCFCFCFALFCFVIQIYKAAYIH